MQHPPLLALELAALAAFVWFLVRYATKRRLPDTYDAVALGAVVPLPDGGHAVRYTVPQTVRIPLPEAVAARMERGRQALAAANAPEDARRALAAMLTVPVCYDPHDPTHADVLLGDAPPADPALSARSTAFVTHGLRELGFDATWTLRCPLADCQRRGGRRAGAAGAGAGAEVAVRYRRDRPGEATTAPWVDERQAWRDLVFAVALGAVLLVLTPFVGAGMARPARR